MSLRLTVGADGVYVLRAYVHCQSVCLSVREVGGGNRTGRMGKMDLISCWYFPLSQSEQSVPMKSVGPLFTCGCLLSVRSKCGNTNELAIRSETNPDNAVRNCQRNPPKKQEQSFQGQADSKCSNSNSRGNLCPR